MSDDLIARLRGDCGPPCTCFAYYPGECACDADWPTYHVAEAADEIERLRRDVAAHRTALLEMRQMIEDEFESGESYPTWAYLTDEEAIRVAREMDATP